MICRARNRASSPGWVFRGWVFRGWVFPLCVACGSAAATIALWGGEVVPTVTEARGLATASASLPFGLGQVEPTSSAMPSTPQLLDGRMVACRAVRNWTPAQALRARGRTVVEAYCDEDEGSRSAARSIAEFLNLQACHQEDIAAANALRAYYTRIALAEQLQLSDESRKLVDEEETKHQTALSVGLATGTDLSGFERRRIEIEDQQVQLRAQDRQLRTLLAELANCDYAIDSVQQEQLDIRANALDCQRLVAIALQRRYDMRSWTYLASQVNETSASIFARMLSTAVGGFGLPLPTIVGFKNLLCPPDQGRLAGNLKCELKLTVETNRRWIQQTVLEKCAKLELAYQRLELAQQTTTSWEERREQLVELEELGKPLPDQSAAARIGWIQSRVEEINRRLDARLAEIELAEATGELGRRCCAGQAWLVTGTEST